MADHADAAPLQLTCGMHVLIAAFDDVPEHVFEIHSVEGDCVTGVALTGPLSGEYGEPELEMILRVID